MKASATKPSSSNRKNLNHVTQKIGGKIRTSLDSRRFNQTTAVAAGLCVLLIGAVFLLVTRAATSTTAVEAELGTKKGNATTVNDTSASGGKYLAFNAPSTGEGGGDGGNTGKTVMIAAAGDISGQSGNDVGTAKLITDRLSQLAWVLPLGDLQYPDSGPTATSSYSKTWGQFKAKTKPSPGNHDYKADNAKAFYNYFGGFPKYYSFNAGDWHLISVNSMESHSSTSAQIKWLENDLAASSAKCTLAYMHHPRYSSPGSGKHGDITSMSPVWDALIKAKADVVLAGHDHVYEHFQPMNSSGGIDLANGLKSFVVGTGGGGDDPVGTKEKGSLGGFSTWGVLFMTLKPTSYDWQFIDIKGKVLNSGSGTCH